MDPGRYVLQQGWDQNSALEGYGSLRDSNYRAGFYGGRRYLDEGFSREPVYARGSLHRDLLDREIYPPGPPPVHGLWSSEIRRRNIQDDITFLREIQRQQKASYLDSYCEPNRYRDLPNIRGLDNLHGPERGGHFIGRERKSFEADDYYRHRANSSNREGVRDRDNDSDNNKGKRESNLRKRDKEKEKKTRSRDKVSTPEKRRHERSRSRGRDDHAKSHSPHRRITGHGQREGSQDDGFHEARSDRRRDHDEKHKECTSVLPSATLVVKGLSQKTTEDDLYQALAEWGPLRHVRVIKERNSGISRGFAFIDFPSIDSARKMLEAVGDHGVVVDGRRLFFEYSSKPTGGLGASLSGSENTVKGSSQQGNKGNAAATDWVCTVCGCVNFARRASCFQCYENKTEDAPPADATASNPAPLGKKGSEIGPTHVLVVRGLDDNADEEILHYEFSKHAPIKDLRLVRDKFTHVSRGFAFIHFHSVDDATKALTATNGKKIEKNGQVLRVAYAKSIHGPNSSAASSQSSSLAAAAIEAATFAQQYDCVGWAPKEYNPDDKQQNENENAVLSNTEACSDAVNSANDASQSAPQSGFVWDEASGYYYDAASGFYYDGHTGLYYDGNNGTWYSYDQDTHQYVPYVTQSSEATNTSQPANDQGKTTEGSTAKKAVISAPASTISANRNESSDKKPSLADAVQAAAAAALAAEKKEKEKAKEVKLASKMNILASKKKINNVLNKWKQRNHEGQAARVVLDDDTSTVEDKHITSSSGSAFAKSTVMPKFRSDISNAATQAVPSLVSSPGETVGSGHHTSENTVKPKPVPVSNSAGGIIRGVIRESTRVRTDQNTSVSTGALSPGTSVAVHCRSECNTLMLPSKLDSTVSTPFKTDPSVLGTYAPPSGAKRRFSETPQSGYRDRAAERRNLYGSAAATDSILDSELEETNSAKRSRNLDLPFPPGVGGTKSSGAMAPSGDTSFEVITADRALDGSNVGNRMLRNMGWQEGLVCYSFNLKRD
eukprot:TRINITY_DN1038_c0_g1_i4.p1 TRINITY_DN1038_c0_g1~~TRINITY_DN1038_c0_g1_i4.p1  ORF type:complete len:1007 (+),score=258.07 TRINITY_DN1038_c0_g1_i4:326-3346(+)